MVLNQFGRRRRSRLFLSFNNARSLLWAPALLTMLLVGCNDHAGAGNAPQRDPPVVVVASPAERDVTDFVEFTGRTDAAETVEIRARVTGFLDKVTFEPGVEVEAGAPLYQIDDREFKAELEAADAALASAKAQQHKATTDFERADTLKQKGAISAEEFDRADAAKKDADASVQSAQARLDQSQLKLDFSRIAAPIAGKISRTQITQGNLVNADATILTTIVSVDPMYVYFDVDERTMLTLGKLVREGQLASREKKDVPVYMSLAIDTDYPHEGRLDFIDNRVDPRTGTIRMRATFQNPRSAGTNYRVLSPGLFARVRAPIGEPRATLLVTERAIGTDQGQKFVYVVDDKSEVVFRPVTLGAIHDGLREISRGLDAGERVIIDGLQRVRPGAVVNPKTGDMLSRSGDSVAGTRTEKASTSEAKHE